MKHYVDRIVYFFETLTPEDVQALGTVYADDARFIDPFNDVCGVGAIQHIFFHMFASLDHPRFRITARIVQGQQCFLTWEFRFAFKRFKVGREQCILGGSHLVLTESGRIALHRDYWDPAQELYEKLPVLGALMRWLKRQAKR